MEKIQVYIEEYKKQIIFTGIIIITILIAFTSFYLIENKYKKNEIVAEVQEKRSNIEEDSFTIKVDIKGLIKNPGVYELKENSRVIDAIEASGGLLENASTRYINLSKILKDENVIIINSKEEIESIIKKKDTICETLNDACLDKDEEISNAVNIEKPTNTEDTKQNTELNTLVNINTASLETLMTLNGVGESKAKSIIDYRNKSGSFKNIEDIKNVTGIGESIYEKIKDHITV